MAQTAAVKQSKANARAQKQLGHNTWRKAFMQHYWLYIMMLPALLYMIIFNYLPMTGLYMAFTDFSPFNGDTILESVFGSPFVGLKYFKKLFTGPDFWTLFRNTLKLYTDPNSYNNYGGLFAMSVISLLPVILIFIKFQKYLVEGIATDGIKG